MRDSLCLTEVLERVRPSCRYFHGNENLIFIAHTVVMIMKMSYQEKMRHGDWWLGSNKQSNDFDVVRWMRSAKHPEYDFDFASSRDGSSTRATTSGPRINLYPPQIIHGLIDASISSRATPFCPHLLCHVLSADRRKRRKVCPQAPPSRVARQARPSITSRHGFRQVQFTEHKYWWRLVVSSSSIFPIFTIASSYTHSQQCFHHERLQSQSSENYVRAAAVQALRAPRLLLAMQNTLQTSRYPLSASSIQKKHPLMATVEAPILRVNLLRLVGCSAHQRPQLHRRTCSDHRPHRVHKLGVCLEHLLNLNHNSLAACLETQQLLPLLQPPEDCLVLRHPLHPPPEVYSAHQRLHLLPQPVVCLARLQRQSLPLPVASSEHPRSSHKPTP